MPKCCVYSCDTKYNESLFSVSKYLKKECEKALNMELKEKSKVCAKHFSHRILFQHGNQGRV